MLATLMLNFSDFARYAPTRRAVIVGNLWGLPINWTLFALTSVTVSASSVKVYGEAFLDPAELMNKIDNDAIALVGAAVFVLATIGVNIVANFVSPAFDLANVWPKHITFKRGGIITAFLALATLPWKLYSSPEIIAYFLGTLGGVNRLAIVAFIPSALVSLYFALKLDVLVPDALATAVEKTSPFDWFLGAGLGALLYLPLARHRDYGADLPQRPAQTTVS